MSVSFCSELMVLAGKATVNNVFPKHVDHIWPSTLDCISSMHEFTVTPSVWESKYPWRVCKAACVFVYVGCVQCAECAALECVFL